MSKPMVRIETTGRVSSHAASTLGAWVEEGDAGVWLVAPYLDQSQLTGLLLQMSELHLDIRSVVIRPWVGEAPTSTSQGDLR